MINKEFRCESCQNEFESLMPVCPRCGGSATRVFLTPPQVVTRGIARRTDRILESNFKQMGISNFSNAGGVNKVSWVSTGSSASTVHGQPQPLIQPIFGGPEQLRAAGFNTANMTMNGKPYQLPNPQDYSVALPELGKKVGQFPPGLREQTTVEGRTDSKGNVVELNGRDGR
jgi:hypothetical protein